MMPSDSTASLQPGGDSPPTPKQAGNSAHASEQQHTQPALSSCTIESAQLSFDCAVCHDTLLDPVVGPCGHDMCRVCYDQWCEASPTGFAACPLCRAPLPRLSVCMRMKRTVEHLMPAAVKRRREEVAACTATCPSKQKSRRCGAECSPRSSQGLTVQGYSPYDAASWAMWHGAYPPMLGQDTQAYMAAMYSYYNLSTLQQQQQLWWQQQWGAVQQAGVPAPASSTGGDTEVTSPASRAEANQPPEPACVQDQLQHGAHGARTSSSSSTGLQYMPGGAGRWQSVADVPMRLSCARAILALLQARAAAAGDAAAQLGNTPAALAAVRAVEVALYREAPSRQQYMDPATLPARVAAFVHRRAAAASRRADRSPAPLLQAATQRVQ